MERWFARAEAFQPGRRYLVTMVADSEKRVGLPTGRWEVMPDGTLRDTTLAPKGTDWRLVMTGLSLEDVSETLRKPGPRHKAR